MNTHANLITRLGGPAKVAEMLGYDKHGGIQRVSNWSRRGIPARVILDRPDVFAALLFKAQAHLNQAPQAEQKG